MNSFDVFLGDRIYYVIKYFVKSSYEISKDGVNLWHDSFARPNDINLWHFEIFVHL